MNRAGLCNSTQDSKPYRRHSQEDSELAMLELPNHPSPFFSNKSNGKEEEPSDSKRLSGLCLPGLTIDSSNVYSTKPVNSLGVPRSSAMKTTLQRHVDIVEQYITAWVTTRSSNVLNVITL